MHTNEPADVLRVVVALAILASKPAGRSLAGYHLDLLSAFPVLELSAIDVQERWRERALALEAERDAARLKLDSARADLRELKRANETNDQDARPKKKKKRNPTSSEKETAAPALPFQLLAPFSGCAPLVESYRILSTFTHGSKSSLNASLNLLTRVASAIPSASPAALSDIALLVQNTMSSTGISAEHKHELACVRLVTAAVHRVESGTREARAVVQALLHVPSAASVVLSASLAALIRTLSRFDTDSGAKRRRPRLVQKDSICMLCWAIHAAVGAGAERVDVGSVLLPDVLELADRAGPVLRTMVLSAVERAWLSGD